MKATLPKGSTLQVGTRIYTVWYPELTRSLTNAEYKSLKTSIEKRGIKMPVVVDENNYIIDGIHRLSIAEELRLDPDAIPHEIVAGLTEEQKHDLAVSLNADRRHLDIEDLKLLRAQRIERVVQGRKEGKSLRTLASEEGISKTQIKYDLEEAQKLHTPGVQGCTPGLDNGTGQPELHTPGETPVSPGLDNGTVPNPGVQGCTPGLGTRQQYRTDQGTNEPISSKQEAKETPVRTQGRDGKSYPSKKPIRLKESSRGSSKETQKRVTDAQPAPLSVSSLSVSNLSDHDLSDSDIIAYLQQLPGDKRRRLLLQVTKHIVEFRSDMERVLQCC